MIVNDSTIHYIERMVDRRHVGESDMSVIRYVKSKLAKGAWEQVENKNGTRRHGEAPPAFRVRPHHFRQGQKRYKRLYRGSV